MTTANNGEVTSADIRRELFEGDNVITDFKDDDRGLSKVLENKKKSNIIVEETEEQVEETIQEETTKTVKDDKVNVN